jgi:hypothetical protein
MGGQGVTYNQAQLGYPILPGLVGGFVAQGRASSAAGGYRGSQGLNQGRVPLRPT